MPTASSTHSSGTLASVCRYSSFADPNGRKNAATNAAAATIATTAGISADPASAPLLETRSSVFRLSTTSSLFDRAHQGAGRLPTPKSVPMRSELPRTTITLLKCEEREDRFHQLPTEFWHRTHERANRRNGRIEHDDPQAAISTRRQRSKASILATGGRRHHT